MKIIKLQINGFGKLNNLDIDLDEGLNIIYGSNEAGKSTLQSFVKAMLYGLKKGKNGTLNDKEKFRPWQGGGYSGSIEYCLDDKQKFRVWRDFESGQTKIYDANLKDITSEFHMDRANGVLFAKEQLGIDQELFESTCFVSQAALRLSGLEQSTVAEKIGMILETGSERASYIAAKRMLEKTLSEDIGTDRTVQKPINKVKEQIIKLREQQKYLDIKFDRSKQLESELKELKNTEKQISKKIENLRQSINKAAQENRNKHSEKANIQLQSLKDELKAKSEELEKINSNFPMGTAIFDDEISERLQVINKSIKRHSLIRKILIAISGGVIILAIGLIIARPQSWLLGLITGAFGAGILLRNWRILPAEEMEELKEILGSAGVKSTEEYLNKKREISFGAEKKKMFEDAVRLIKTQIEVLDSGSFMGSKSKNIFNERYEEGALEENKLYEAQNKLKEIELRIKEYETELRILDDEIEKRAEIEEQLELVTNKKDELEEQRYCIKMALDEIQFCTEELKNNVVPGILTETGRITKILTGSCTSVGFDTEVSQIMIGTEFGKVVSVSQLSNGTIDQIYLALRFSLCNMISESGESLSIIFDEPFASFDDDRFARTMEILKEISVQKQVIVFSCKENEVANLKKSISTAKVIRL